VWTRATPDGTGMTRLYSVAVKTAVSIPDELFAAGDHLARQRGMSRSELYATALELYLAGAADDHVTAALDTVYVDGAGALDADLARAQRDLLDREP